MLHCCNEVPRLVSLTSKLQKSCKKRDKDVKEVGLPLEYGTLLEPRNPLQMYFSGTKYTLSISSAEEGL